MDIQSFIDSNARAITEVLDLNTLNYKTVSDLASLSSEEVKNSDFPILCDNPKWAIKSVNSKGQVSIYSNDGSDEIHMPTRKRTSILSYDLLGNKLSLKRKNSIIFADDDASDLTGTISQENKEELTMGNELDELMNQAGFAEESTVVESDYTANDSPATEEATVVEQEPVISELPANDSGIFETINPEASQEKSELDVLMEQAEIELGGGSSANGVQNMTAFGGEDDGNQVGDSKTPAKKVADPEAEKQKEADRVKAAQMRKKIREDVSRATGNNQIDMSTMEAIWKSCAQLICFVPPTDKRQTITAVKIPVKAADRELINGAPEEISAAFLKDPSNVGSEWIKTTYEVRARESKPGRPSGAIVRIPACLRDCTVTDYVKTAALDKARKALAENDESVVMELMTIPEFEQKLTFVGSSIMEAPETAPENGRPGEIKILYGQPNSNATNDGSDVLVDQGFLIDKKLVKVGNGNRTPMHDRNYFPLTTYEVVDIYSNMDAATVEALNKTTFEGLFNPAKNSNQAGTKYSNLRAEDRIHISKTEEGIKSDYITTQASRVSLTVTAFYDKNCVRNTIQLPLKKQPVKPDGTLGAAKFVKYNVTMEDKMADPEYYAKSALGRPEFAHIVELVGTDLLRPAVLKEKFRRTSSTASASRYLGADVARDLLLAMFRGGLDNYEINGFSFD